MEWRDEWWVVLVTTLAPDLRRLLREGGRQASACSCTPSANRATKDPTWPLTSKGLHVSHRHSQDGQFVRLPCQSTACRHHVGQLCDVRCHLVPPSPLDLTVVLPASETRAKRRQESDDMSPGIQSRQTRQGGQDGRRDSTRSRRTGERGRVGRSTLDAGRTERSVPCPAADVPPWLERGWRGHKAVRCREER